MRFILQFRCNNKLMFQLIGCVKSKVNGYALKLKLKVMLSKQEIYLDIKIHFKLHIR